MLLNNKYIKFKIALFALLLYELAMLVFKLDGLSLSKIILTLLVWISCGIAVFEYLKKHQKLKRIIPKYPFIILIALLGWNLITILKSAMDGGSISTLFGNVYTTLALLVPVIIIFSIDKINLKVLLDFFIIWMRIGVFTFLVLLLVSRGDFNDTQLLVLILLLQPTVFLVTLYPFLQKKSRVLLLISAALLFYVSFHYGNRTMMIREILLFTGLIGIYLYLKFQLKTVLSLSFVLLLIPFILLHQSIDTGESAFETVLSNSSQDDLNVDTRTFLYVELYEDLVDNSRVIVGKGANGTYYSEYFSFAEGDAANRMDVEVGVLSMLLKGGLIAVILNLSIFILAIYYAFFRANNLFVVGIGYILLLYTILLFIDNRIGFTTDNFLVWFFVGVCLSKEIRLLKNNDIISLLTFKI